MKICFELNENPHSPYTVERLWAVDLLNGGYKIDNSPFDVYDISHKDIVSAKCVDGELVFQTVIKRGQHSTIRIRLNSSHATFLGFWGEFSQLNCSFEGAGKNGNRLYSIDVPPSADVKDVLQKLADLEKQGSLEYEEAHIYQRK
ncbi:DUF4265 domain-containing protein [Catenovulum sediminis]|uniref:DUF4265 domain-containing protein n=1 Tax=Catenovulum sediminis TaxID=1740262 RepID=A0ABV1RH53_9ALTE